MNYSILIIGGLAFLGAAYYGYHRSHIKDGKDKPLLTDALFNELLSKNEPEYIEMLKLSDVVSYFKGLSLKKDVDTPFVAKVEKGGKEIILFATYNNGTDDVENFKLICANHIDDELKKVMGNEKLVVLS